MSTAIIYGGASYNAPSYTATLSPGFYGDGSGLTNITASQIILDNPNYAVITNASSELTTEQYLSTVRGGTSVDSSSFTGVAKVNSGVWSASEVTGSDIATETITGSNIASATVTGSNIATETITGTNIASATVTGSNIANTTITDANIATNAGIVDTKLATISSVGKVANTATTATSANTANAIVSRDSDGNFTASAITTTQITQLPNADAQTTIQSSYVSTTNATPTTLFTLATVSAGSHGTTYLVTCNVSLGDVTGGTNTGTYQFQFKVKNIGGTLTLSTIINNISILDGTLTNTAVSITNSSENALVQVTGIAATTINWSGSYTITQVNF